MNKNSFHLKKKYPRDSEAKIHPSKKNILTHSIYTYLFINEKVSPIPEVRET
jgi:hypothetical protein